MSEGQREGGREEMREGVRDGGTKGGREGGRLTLCRSVRRRAAAGCELCGKKLESSRWGGRRG